MPQGCFAVGAIGDLAARFAQLLLGRYQQACRLGRLAVTELFLRASRERDGVDVQRVAEPASVARRADIGARAAELPERGEGAGFLRVRCVAQDFDRARDAGRALLGGEASRRASAEQAGQRQPHRAGSEANQSADFGGGPIWIRSPMYEPISVNTTPKNDISAYMNAGMVFTV